MTNAALDAGALLRRLYEAGVEYVVIGGLAVIAYGVQRFTNDLDVPLRSNTTRDLAEGGNFRLLTRDGVLDVMEWTANPARGGERANPKHESRAHRPGSLPRAGLRRLPDLSSGTRKPTRGWWALVGVPHSALRKVSSV